MAPMVADDGRSNWRRAVEVHQMAVLVSDLIAIGVTLGLEMAERVYLSLRDEPRAANGMRIDWSVIRREIEDQQARQP